MAALFAAGMDPKVMAPMATTTQAAIRARPEIEGLILLVSVLTAVLLLVGGAVGDTRRARPIITGGLAVSLVCGVLAPSFSRTPGRRSSWCGSSPSRPPPW